MRVYLELIEIPPDNSTEEPDSIRIDITDWSQSDIDAAIALLKEHAKTYNSYILQIHYCYHDENRSCSVTVIEQMY